MKVALIHDYLNQYGGAERVLECLIEMFPEAPIYTLLYDEQKTRDKFIGKKIITSFLDFKLVHNHHRWFIPLMPLAMKAMKIDDSYDLIISATAGYAKGIGHAPRTKHFCYCYTPLRYAWESSYFISKFRNIEMSIFFRTVSKPILSYLRKWDFNMAQRPEKMVTLSNHIAKKIKSYYGREAEVLYPPVNTGFWNYESGIRNYEYYLAGGRLIHYKNFDLIVKAFNLLNKPLKIFGGGPELESLKKIANANIEFTGKVSDNQLRDLYRGAKGFIFANAEDFGLVMAEAQACGAPVIALAEGGALEIVQSGKTGLFFQRLKMDDLILALKDFEKIDFDRSKISESVQRFSVSNFKGGLTNILRGL